MKMLIDILHLRLKGIHLRYQTLDFVQTILMIVSDFMFRCPKGSIICNATPYLSNVVKVCPYITMPLVNLQRYQPTKIGPTWIVATNICYLLLHWIFGVTDLSTSYRLNTICKATICILHCHHIHYHRNMHSENYYQQQL